MNLVTPERRLTAAQEIREGRCYCLSMPLDMPGGNAVNPKRFPPEIKPVFNPPESGDVYFNYRWDHEKPDCADLASDECVTLYSQYSTQWDSLAHIGALFDADGDGEPEAVYYNGYRAGEHVKGPDDPAGMGARALGVEPMALGGMQGRGVLVDFRKHFGNERVAVDYDMLMEVFRKDDIVVEEGDFFLFHTGWDDLILSMHGDPDAELLHSSGAVLDGFDERILQW
ncbi:MAG: cyclase family protein, partial [Alphaproteobacteria bacterium]